MSDKRLKKVWFIRELCAVNSRLMSALHVHSTEHDFAPQHTIIIAISRR